MILFNTPHNLETRTPHDFTPYKPLSSPYELSPCSNSSATGNVGCPPSMRSRISLTYPRAEEIRVLPPHLVLMGSCDCTTSAANRSSSVLLLPDNLSTTSHDHNLILSYQWSPTAEDVTNYENCIHGCRMASKASTLTLTSLCEYWHYECPLLRFANIDAYQFMLRWQLHRQAWILHEVMHNSHFMEAVENRLHWVRTQATKHDYELPAMRHRLHALETSLWNSIVAAQRKAGNVNSALPMEEYEYIRLMGYEMVLVQIALLIETMYVRARQIHSPVEWFCVWVDIRYWDFCTHTL